MMKKEEKSKDIIFLPLILSGVILVGVVGYVLLNKLSYNNKYICGYLGGLWMKKDADPIHRCYTYDEYYN